MINIFKLFKEWKKRKEAKIFNALVTKKLEKASALIFIHRNLTGQAIV
tara:strand:+ start:4116 stop:4259 length:144 start_codon:yes stop_codon:yes gene_type:complete